MTSSAILTGDSVACLFALLFVGLVGGLEVARRRWPRDRELRLVKEWAARQEFKLLHWEARGRGPFVFPANERQVVYRITAQFLDGRVASGWVRCGSSILGLMGEDVEVRWDEDPNAARQPHGFPVIVPPDQRGRAG